MSNARFIIGLGTGRCGTKTLSGLLTAQPGAHVTHERYGPVVKWEGSDAYADRIAEPESDGRLRVYGDVSINWLPYAERLADHGALFIVLQREFDAWKASWMRHMQDFRWFWPGGSTPAASWDGSLPVYHDNPSKAEAVKRYYTEYYHECEQLQAAYSGS